MAAQPDHTPEWIAARDEYLGDRAAGESPLAAFMRRVRAAVRMCELDTAERASEADRSGP